MNVIQLHYYENKNSECIVKIDVAAKVDYIKIITIARKQKQRVITSKLTATSTLWN